MNQIITNMTENEKYNNLLNLIKEGKKNISLSGLQESFKAHLVYSLTANLEKSSCIICSSNMEAKKIMQDLKFFSDIEVVYFPARQIVYYDVEAESKEIESARMQAINSILSGKKIIVVTTIDATVQKMPDISKFSNLSLDFKVGNKVNVDSVLTSLITLGYERASFVEGKGQFAVRGGIIDIFGVTDETPKRIELFGDEVDSIRSFDVITQRSIENLEEFKIDVASEFLITEDRLKKAAYELQNKIKGKNISNKLKQSVQKDVQLLEDFEYNGLIDKYFKLLIDTPVSLLENLKDFVIYLNEPARCREKISSIIYENSETVKMLMEKEYLLPEYINDYASYEEFESKLKNIQSVLLYKIGENQEKGIISFEFDSKETIFFKNSPDTLFKDISERKENTILLVFPNAMRVTQIMNMLIDEKINVKKVDNIFQEKLQKGKVYIMQGILSGGYDIKEFGITIISEQVSGIYNKQKRKRVLEGENVKKINTFEDLKVGQYVVHEMHGIGIYKGIETVEIDGVVSDYIKIEYEGDSHIFVPISQLDSVKKYMYNDEIRPKINTLGSKEWIRAKARAKSSIDEIAKELVQLYAVRNKAKGFAFSKDTPWQKEFEEDFPYELTEDQAYAVEEIKKDMEDEKPMDRLLCGDVGYGKTEVAIRAAFKAVMDSKQVAYLVPTTVLSLQQYNTFKNRMEKYGIKVEMLSRFKTKKEQNKIVEGLALGKIDIIIGTHRMLSKDVKFKDLGLLIIDEEHRFGVKAKETIKELKQNVDVLSMTATPIPRTLNMSVIGVRSMSTLTNPPLERMPVHTYVMEYDENIIKVAIDRELARDGQVFYINNRVDNIERVTEKVRMLAPTARVAYAHGQMDPDEIEDIMLKFVNHDIDIIVCTTILESGIDIPNANTLIVEDADNLGLAALYQIRGRVGRSSRLAFAYITYKKNKVLSEVSEKRLKAIKDFTEFGSGFKIAMRDLEIRGAGNMLGKAQHGHMAKVGYEMYVSMLEKAVSKMKNEKSENAEDNIQMLEVKIDIPVSAYIPDTYISELVAKISMYHKISEITNKEESLNVIEEFLDRYGPMPKEVENLIKVVEIRNACRKLGITKVYIRGDYLVFASNNSSSEAKYYIRSKDLLMFTEFCLKELEKIIKEK